MSERKLLGDNLGFDEAIALAQLVQQPGWKVLVRLMAEACRNATEAVIKLDPVVDKYAEKVAALQMTARAINKFSAEVLDSVKLHQRKAVVEAQQKESPMPTPASKKRFRMELNPPQRKQEESNPE